MSRPTSNTRGERLAKFMAACGVASRRKCEEIIRQGRVKVNGHLVESPAMNVAPNLDIIEVDGKALTPERPVHILLNKPRGVTCTAQDRHAAKIVADLLPKSFGRLFTVGRLDRDSEGLIICTNDGDFAQKVAHPRHETTKTYHVDIDREPDPRALKRILEGIQDEGESLKARSVRPIASDHPPSHRLEFVLDEGRKREVRRLCKAMGWTVQRLVRVAIGNVVAPKLRTGEWRQLTQDEIDSLSHQSK